MTVGGMGFIPERLLMMMMRHPSHLGPSLWPGGLWPGGLWPGGLWPGGLWPGGLRPGGLVVQRCQELPVPGPWASTVAYNLLLVLPVLFQYYNIIHGPVTLKPRTQVLYRLYVHE